MPNEARGKGGGGVDGNDCSAGVCAGDAGTGGPGGRLRTGSGGAPDGDATRPGSGGGTRCDGSGGGIDGGGGPDDRGGSAPPDALDAPDTPDAPDAPDEEAPLTDSAPALIGVYKRAGSDGTGIGGGTLNGVAASAALALGRGGAFDADTLCGPYET